MKFASILQLGRIFVDFSMDKSLSLAWTLLEVKVIILIQGIN